MIDQATKLLQTDVEAQGNNQRISINADLCCIMNYIKSVHNILMQDGNDDTECR